MPELLVIFVNFTNSRTDTFSVTGGTGVNTPPIICGTNTGEHSKNINIILSYEEQLSLDFLSLNYKY